MLHSAIVGKGTLKALHFFPEDKRGFFRDAIQGSADFVAHLGILCSQVKIRNFIHTFFLSEDASPTEFQCTLPSSRDFIEPAILLPENLSEIRPALRIPGATRSSTGQGVAPGNSTNSVPTSPAGVILCMAKPSSPPPGSQEVAGATCQVMPPRSNTRPLCQCPTSICRMPSRSRRSISRER